MEYLIENYFHYPTTKSPEYLKLLRDTTLKYGNLTSLTLVVFLVCLATINWLVKRGYYWHNNFQVLKWCYGRLNGTGRVTSIARTLVFRFYYHISTIFQLVLWCAVLSALSLSDLHQGDLIFLARRLGRVAVNSLPTILFMTIRPSPLPNTLYLALVPIHKWLSRFVIFQLVVHTILYLGYFNFKGTQQKAFKKENLYGWLALVGFLAIFVTSVSRFRNYFYKVFYVFHYLCTWIIVISLQYHVRPVHMPFYTLVNVLILVYQIYNRLSMIKVSEAGDVKITNVSPNLVYVEFPASLVALPSLTPGSHIRLTKYSLNIWRRLYSQLIPNYHPYTLVSLPHDYTQKLIVRKGHFKFVDHKYLITGSYDANLLFVHNKTNRFQISRLTINTKRVLIVVGGSAISFALPILRVMNYHGVPVKIVWVIKDFRDIAILRFFDGYIHGDDFEIFVTGSEIIDDARSTKSYGTFNTSSQVNRSFDPESNEQQSLLTFQEEYSRWEDEDVDISVDEEESTEEEDEDCCNTEAISSDAEVIDEEVEEIDDSTETSMADISPVPSIKTTTSSGTNEQFIPRIKSVNEFSRSYLAKYRETVRRLNIVNRIYKGRPRLNYRYYNWCLHEGFTQCSGPVHLGGESVCCRDLPRNNVSEADASKVWVISAGPKGLVNNVKVWASENGLKFHEEAFYS